MILQIESISRPKSGRDDLKTLLSHHWRRRSTREGIAERYPSVTTNPRSEISLVFPGVWLQPSMLPSKSKRGFGTEPGLPKEDL